MMTTGHDEAGLVLSVLRGAAQEVVVLLHWEKVCTPPELVSGQSSDSSSAWVPRRIGAVWRWFLIVVIDFKFRAHKITTYTEKRQIIIGKIWGRRNFFFKIYRTITDHSGRLPYRLSGEGAKVNRWSSESKAMLAWALQSRDRGRPKVKSEKVKSEKWKTKH